MHDELTNIYRVFSRYPSPATLEGCPCCTSSAESRVLCAASLHAITVSQLEHFAFKALSTWGTLQDYKYFLPRILELTAEGSLLCDLEVTLGKLTYGGFREWPDDEQGAIRDYIFELWKKCVESSEDDSRADALLCGAAAVLDDVSPLLEYADAVSPAFKSAYLAEHSNPTKRKLLNSFWDSSSANYKRVLGWLYPISK